MDEAFFCFEVSGEIGRQEFQRDGALEFGVLGLLNIAHFAATQLLNDLVVRYRLTDHSGWLVG